MKKVLLTVAIAGLAASVFAQGTIAFVMNSGTTFRAPIYGPQLGDPTAIVTGNNASPGTPAGTAIYTGALLAGAGFRAQMFAAPGNDALVSSLVAASPITTFRTGTAAGYLAPATATLVGVAGDAPAATVQVRAWDNSSGLYADWAAAEPAWRNGLIAAGMSLPANVAAIGGAINGPPVPTNLRSFNIYMIPEPSTFALAGLGAAALLIFRRRN